MFHLTMHSTHFIYGYMVSDIQIAKEETRCRHMDYSFRLAAKKRRKEGNVSFNDALNTFYLRLYGVGHSDSERGNLLSPYGLFFPISSKEKKEGRKEMFYLMMHSTQELTLPVTQVSSITLHSFDFSKSFFFKFYYYYLFILLPPDIDGNGLTKQIRKIILIKFREPLM